MSLHQLRKLHSKSEKTESDNHWLEAKNIIFVQLSEIQKKVIHNTFENKTINFVFEFAGEFHTLAFFIRGPTPNVF